MHANGRALACCRVMTDYVYRADILDLVVSERGKEDARVAQKLLESVKRQPMLRLVRGWRLVAPQRMQREYAKVKGLDAYSGVTRVVSSDWGREYALVT